MERRHFLKSGAGLGLAIAAGIEPAGAAQSRTRACS